MRVGDLPYLELVVDGGQVANLHRIRGVPFVVSLTAAKVYTLDREEDEALTQKLKEKFCGRGINAALAHKIAAWLTEEARALS